MIQVSKESNSLPALTENSSILNYHTLYRIKMATSEHVNGHSTVNEICKSCIKRGVNNQKCITCDAKYHSSFTQRIK